jgi:putative hydrolase of the HAD superfamily
MTDRAGYPLSRMQGIKSIIFDWGGVLIDDPAPALMRYCADALSIPKENYTKAHRKFAADFQTGHISEDVFWQKVCGELNVPKPRNRSLWSKAFEAVYSPRTEVFSLARLLHRNGYRTGFLSNTEVPAMNYFYQQKYDMFDAAVFSCAEGILKPDRRIYELTLERLKTQPGEAVFIDDRQDFINGAKEAGLNTILFKSIGQVKTELARLGVKTD